MSLNEVIRGDTKKWSLAFEDANGNALNLAGCTVWFTVKVSPSNITNDSDAILQQKIVINSLGNPTFADGFSIGGTHPVTGQVVTGAESGVLTQTLSAATSTLLSPGKYVYDIQIKLGSGEIYTPINGLVLTVLEDITRSMT